MTRRNIFFQSQRKLRYLDIIVGPHVALSWYKYASGIRLSRSLTYKMGLAWAAQQSDQYRIGTYARYMPHRKRSRGKSPYIYDKGRFASSRMGRGRIAVLQNIVQLQIGGPVTVRCMRWLA